MGRQEHGTCDKCGSPVLLADAAGRKMEALSPVAMAMLGRGRRHKAQRDPGAIIEQITMQGYPSFEPIVHFQIRYGGVEYLAADEGGFYFDLFMPNLEFGEDRCSTEQDDNGIWYYELGTPRVAQIYYKMRQDGVVCSGGDEGMVPIASSVEKYIENDAVGDEMRAIQLCWWQVPLGAIQRDDRRLDAIVAVGHSVIERASDDYTTWWEDDNSRIRRGVAHDAGPNWHMVHAYFQTREVASSFVDVVRDVIAGPFDIYRFALE